jgi:hypothetical protein
MIGCKKIMMICAFSATTFPCEVQKRQEEREARLQWALARGTKSLDELGQAAKELKAILWEERKKKEQERAGVAKL